MKMEKDSRLPLYLQLKEAILHSIRTGELKPGNMMPTEQELCKTYGISRYPVRQAMEELVTEGYLYRTRGRGTFISEELPEKHRDKSKRLLGIVLGALGKGFAGQILSGFEKQARKCGYLTVACCSEGNPDEEMHCIERLLEQGAAGIFVFPCDDSRVRDRWEQWREQGIYLGLLDRNLGISQLDYVGSDNAGGAYTAVRHLAMQGYRNVAFVSDTTNASSVDERLEGYMKAVADFGLDSVNHIDIQGDLGKYPYSMHRFVVNELKDELIELKKHTPVGIFAINDWVALQCMRILREEGMGVGREIGLVGFDNETECEMAPVPLTSVAQNGLLIGQAAADIAIGKLEGTSVSVHKSIVPTQLVVRNSCGERD